MAPANNRKGVKEEDDSSSFVAVSKNKSPFWSTSRVVCCGLLQLMQRYCFHVVVVLMFEAAVRRVVDDWWGSILSKWATFSCLSHRQKRPTPRSNPQTITKHGNTNIINEIATAACLSCAQRPSVLCQLQCVLKIWSPCSFGQRRRLLGQWKNGLLFRTANDTMLSTWKPNTHRLFNHRTQQWCKDIWAWFRQDRWNSGNLQHFVHD